VTSPEITSDNQTKPAPLGSRPPLLVGNPCRYGHSITRHARRTADLSPGQSVRGRVPGLPVRDRCLVMGIVNVTPDSLF
jgi:hypothetical protein